MKQPSTKTMITGHPVVAMPLMAAGCATLAAGLYGSNLLVAFIGMAAWGTAQKAYGEAKAYRAWKQEWDGMAPADRTVRKRNWRLWATIGLALGVFGLACAGGEDPHKAAVGALLLAGLAVVAVMVCTAVFRIARRRRRLSAGSAVVAVVARPVMATPSLADAYRALPPYCHALLARQ